MSHKKHSKGPWYFAVCGSDLRVISKTHEAVATVSGPDQDVNARLISLAPELVELLKNGLDCGVFDDAPVYRSDVRKLLKRVKGVKS